MIERELEVLSINVLSKKIDVKRIKNLKLFI